MSRLMPAEIDVPNHVQRLLIVDRTAPLNEGLAALEGLISGEVPFEVRNAVEATISSVQQELNTSPRFEVIRARERLKGGLFAQVFPTPLTWPQIEALCNEYEADAVLALEKFSSDFIITDKKQLIKKTEGEGRNSRTVEVQGIYAEGVASVKVGFRLYDPQSKNITDQRDFEKTNLWSAEAETRAQALALMIDKAKATQYVGQVAGTSYAHRIAPMYLNINRTIFQKPKSNIALVLGARHGEVNQWEEAIDVWKDGLNDAINEKEGGRICYNIAVGYEVLGELESAKFWAGRAYTNYGLKQGRAYADQLNTRIMQEERLRQQLKRDF
ncbi:DUF6340 family protein [Belliella kenyensis]|uniref:DUF6340 family protein n=1 Tax=Belliella kenyensis TaxID=1472724 RepID=A0ABV8EQC4_9BACT|nr:DUF6340 family protein [Belliella kenyensis]MCH7403600.1 DUF6340 family protein [Belliella kenyensis]MDN3603848.1 DUF6340 family protein [Belliella kenyensis]